jgi:DNA-binding phage protein
MSKNVVALRAANSAVTDENTFIADLQGFMWNNQGPTRTWQDLADDAGLCYGTVYNIAVGHTKRPQMRTVEKLMKALGFRIAFVPQGMPKVQGELRMEQYRNVRRRA